MKRMITERTISRDVLPGNNYPEALKDYLCMTVLGKSLDFKSICNELMSGMFFKSSWISDFAFSVLVTGVSILMATFPDTDDTEAL